MIIVFSIILETIRIRHYLVGWIMLSLEGSETTAKEFL